MDPSFAGLTQDDTLRRHSFSLTAVVISRFVGPHGSWRASDDIGDISMHGGPILQARYRYRYRYRYRMAGLERRASIAIAIPIAIAITNKPPVVISRFVGEEGP